MSTDDENESDSAEANAKAVVREGADLGRPMTPEECEASDKEWARLEADAAKWEEENAKRPEVIQRSKDNAMVLAGGYPESYVAAELEHQLRRKVGGNFDVDEYIAQLDQISQNIIDGDERNIQRLLVIQMQLCHRMFIDCMGHAMERMHNHHIVKAYTDIAMKMEAQSRRTATALVRINRPGVQVNIEQANIANNQQVNNTKNTHTEILEVPGGERVDGGEKETSVRADPALEAVGTDNWPQGHQQDEIQRTEVRQLHGANASSKKDDSKTEPGLKAVGDAE
jgi:hypothetical protein